MLSVIFLLGLLDKVILRKGGRWDEYIGSH
jgi:hypothetical protein